MNSKSTSSYINGVIAGAVAVLALMSAAFWRTTISLEGKLGFTSIELQIAIVLGIAVSITAMFYELYSQTNKKTQQNSKDKLKDSEKNDTTVNE